MRDNNKFNVTTSNILYVLTLFCSIHSYAQFISTCGADFHGNGHADQDCIEDIVVTSTESEASEGFLKWMQTHDCPWWNQITCQRHQ